MDTTIGSAMDTKSGNTGFSFMNVSVIFLSLSKNKNVPWHILAPRRGCFGSHIPLRRVRILAELFV